MYNKLKTKPIEQLRSHLHTVQWVFTKPKTQQIKTLLVNCIQPPLNLFCFCIDSCESILLLRNLKMLKLIYSLYL